MQRGYGAAHARTRQTRRTSRRSHPLALRTAIARDAEWDLGHNPRPNRMGRTRTPLLLPSLRSSRTTTATRPSTDSVDTALSFEANGLLKRITGARFPRVRGCPEAVGDSDAAIRHILAALQYAIWTSATALTVPCGTAVAKEPMVRCTDGWEAVDADPWCDRRAGASPVRAPHRPHTVRAYRVLRTR